MILFILQIYRGLTESLLGNCTTKPHFLTCCAKWITNLSLKSFFFSFSVFRQLFAFVGFQTLESSLQSLHGYVPGVNSNLFVDNEINLYKKIIIEEMIRPYFYLILSYFKIENNFFILEDIVL